ncbi:50S ribosomal protein L18 [Candidatus Zinderia endosymbiont of Aphrophora alni]|uniref:50S ribosomal protein L18 n=1 Tax=Candidatus Zinderia endosymbiont of Aphrophora alni TaxID=3077951 RepID=UPI0030CC5F51
MNKKKIRLRRSFSTRIKIAKKKKFRFVVNKTNLHIYANIINYNMKILVSSSSLESEVKLIIANYKKNFFNKKINFFISKLIGKRIAKKSLKIGIKKVAFDRSGFKYHGHIKLLAESARKAGLKF